MVDKHKSPLFHKDNSSMVLGQVIHTGMAAYYNSSSKEC